MSQIDATPDAGAARRRRMRLRAASLFGRLAPALAAAGLLAAPPAAAEMQDRSITVRGSERPYLLFLPDRRDQRGGIPLVVALHGGGGTAQLMLLYSRLNEVAARENFAVAYPQGVNWWWNDGRLIDGRGETDADDVGYIRAVVADVGTVAALDRRRIYATGISNGGFMSLRLACEAADVFAAVAPVAATMPADLGPHCRPARPVSVLLIHGTADRFVPYVGGLAQTPYSVRGSVWSADRTVAFWARRNRCADTPAVRMLPDRDPGDGSRVIEADYRGCPDAPLTLLRIEGGGHTWPGSVNIFPDSMLGPTNRDIDASAVIWSFFKAAPAKEPVSVLAHSARPAGHPAAAPTLVR